MRTKDLWLLFPLPAKIKLIWDRMTLTKVATFYFLFSVLHCVVQIVFQVQAFHINAKAAEYLASIIKEGNSINPDAFYVFGDDLRLCHGLPMSFNTRSCQVIWNGAVGNNTMVPTSVVPLLGRNVTTDTCSTGNASTTSTSSISNLAPTMATAQSISVTTNGFSTSFLPTTTPSPTSQTLLHASPRAAVDAGSEEQDEVVSCERAFQAKSTTVSAVNITGETHVVVNGFPKNESAVLDATCLWALGWPVQTLRETKREDITFIMFQIWVLGMSIVAILNESVPHLIASLLTHLAATGWTGFQIFSTTQFHKDFTEVTTNGACYPVDLLPAYWQSRSEAEMWSLVLNAVALLVSVLLSWRLSKAFGWQTFKRVGASRTISRVYNFVLMFSITIQLSLFFIVVSIALWLDQLWNGAIAHMATLAHLYRPVLVLILILLPPWLAFGWYSVRRESKTEMLMFLVMCLCYLAGWGAMFDSTTFRWTYLTWSFFGVMTTSSVSLTLLAFILGIACRLNFGKGLSSYLNAEEPLDGDFEEVLACDPEKTVPRSNIFNSRFSRSIRPLQLPAQIAGLRLAPPVDTRRAPSTAVSIYHSHPR